MRGLGVALEEGVLGFGVERGGWLVEDEEERVVAHEASGECELLPLTEGDVDSTGPGRAELGVETGSEVLHDIARAGSSDSRRHRGLVVQSRQVAHPHRVTQRELESIEVLKRT